MSERLFRPGVRLGSYPQKQESALSDFEKKAANLFDRLRFRFTRRQFNQSNIVKKIDYYGMALKSCDEPTLTKSIAGLREKLIRHGLTEDLMVQAFAVIREAADRTLHRRHFDEQLFGGWLMINGMLAEMQTGEGKTLTTTLPACTAAMAGIPVHVLTANDYLAARDADIMQPLYQRLGLSSGSVIDGMKAEQRRDCYQCDIIHTTNKQIAFDYLRDRIDIGEDTGPLKFQFKQIQREIKHTGNNQPLLRGLCFALIDEADSVLIDEAKTPLIITKSKPNEEQPETYSDAFYLAASLFINDDFTIDSKTHEVEFSQEGEDKLSGLIMTLPKFWQNQRKRELLVKLAIKAEYFYKKNKHYVVNQDKIQIVDEFTGRIMADRAWEQGLHQMIEAKEGCLISEQREPVARISYQRFFTRYLKLGGTSGTIKEVAAEMHSVYGLPTIKVQTHRPSKRKMLQERIYRTWELKKQALLDRVAELYALHRPILIGTCSVAESEEVSAWLTQAGYPHRVLNANQDKDEAEIIAGAGQQQAITVATNMAGRGTDIALGPGVSELGGLHVIALSSNDSRRIDRQLYGRCARQGDPGSAEAILSLQDHSLQNFYSSTMLSLMAQCCFGSQYMPEFLGQLAVRIPQLVNEFRQRKMRAKIAEQDKNLSRILAFSGKFE